MNKPCIISGPAGSGKSWVSYAIEQTHKKVAKAKASFLLRYFDYGIPINLPLQYSLIVIEECSIEDIIQLDLLFGNGFPIVDMWTNETEGNIILPIIYLTQDNVTNRTPGFKRFYVINMQPFNHSSLLPHPGVD